ncbi:MAG: universal stress protein [Rubripirellula sp.]
MNEFKNILVATDTRLTDHPIVRESAEIARKNSGKLTIIDVAPDFPWTVKLTMHDHQHLHDLLVQEKSEALEKLAAPLRESGLEVSTKVLEGKSSVEIIREVIRGGHDLVMRIAKGTDSRSGGFFGNTGARLLRQCPCSVWLVSQKTKPVFNHILACVDTASDDAMDQDLNQRVFDLATKIHEYHQGKLTTIHTWSIWNEQMLKGRLGQEMFEQLEEKTKDVTTERLNAFLGQQGEHESGVEIIKGEPEEVIPGYTVDHEVDLVVMGTVARSGIAGMVTGNSAEAILSNIKCSVLALKPSNFVSPIKDE